MRENSTFNGPFEKNIFCGRFAKPSSKDAKATKAIQAVNNAWAILRDPKSRTEYNQKIVEDAMAEESKASRSTTLRQAATSQKQAKSSAVGKKKGKSNQDNNQKVQENKNDPPKSCGSSSAAAGATKQKEEVKKPCQKASASSSKASEWVYCRLIEQKAATICKSLLAKLHRRFEHKDWAGTVHAVCVAKEFQRGCESMVLESLSLKKLDELKSLCRKLGIEIPAARLSKAGLVDHIEEARASQGV